MFNLLALKTAAAPGHLDPYIEKLWSPEGSRIDRGNSVIIFFRYRANHDEQWAMQLASNFRQAVRASIEHAGGTIVESKLIASLRFLQQPIPKPADFSFVIKGLGFKVAKQGAVTRYSLSN
jgi:hypothetical protein